MIRIAKDKLIIEINHPDPAYTLGALQQSLVDVLQVSEDSDMVDCVRDSRSHLHDLLRAMMLTPEEWHAMQGELMRLKGLQ